MINPIEHSKTKDTAIKYKVEPYVIAADIYGRGNLAGRGGWTWYTGSSSWFYKAGIEYILGLKIREGYLSIKPAVPNYWKEYSIQYKYGNSIYNIFVERKQNKNNRDIEMYLNEKKVEEGKIKLLNTGGVYNVKVII